MNNKESLSQAGYTFIKKVDGIYYLRDEDGKYEAWGKNKNHASYGLRYKNTHLEFLYSVNNNEVISRLT